MEQSGEYNSEHSTSETALMQGVEVHLFKRSFKKKKERKHDINQCKEGSHDFLVRFAEVAP